MISGPSSLPASDHGSHFHARLWLYHTAFPPYLLSSHCFLFSFLQTHSFICKTSFPCLVSTPGLLLLSSQTPSKARLESQLPFIRVRSLKSHIASPSGGTRSQMPPGTHRCPRPLAPEHLPRLHPPVLPPALGSRFSARLANCPSPWRLLPWFLLPNSPNGNENQGSILGTLFL